ncbi:hypothetical protein DICSQDRAFT_58059 [Dichomitus squalens LYAD-421 SS1]|uniref:uncharacterized protein n=1 Tax=Dichomitus squalens (strain LYAD-421) TaxID=732165 RepID=UPI0004416151|nr:uncharacterized protein DICSQDRAFT_58059 [Dichomitus squalens LYAD-421 SS1]EJF62760.1 hypothetical protein DICSQDRAFT_58059 [Dichomitus squalens LYAD-421 SS1]
MQSGVGDPSRPEQSHLKSIQEIITPFYGDLSTYEHVRSAKRQRKQEKMTYNRLQSCEIGLGLFHFKMAAADAFWRIVSEKEEARRDSMSFMKVVAKLRPDDSSWLVSGAKFRERHKLIADVGTVLRLDAWRVAVLRSEGFASLESWAMSKPSLAKIEEIAERLVMNYTEGDGIDLYALKTRSSATRDQVQENTIRTHHYMLLYEELSYAMNTGDIRRLETVLVPWILLFRATGKHKYGNYTLRFSHALYFIYPEGKHFAFRMLVNPSGEPGEFRAVDWVIELLNLYNKDTYGGSGSNYTKERILFESILVRLFRSSHAKFERNFCISGLSHAHAKKDMRKTFKVVLEYLTAPEQLPNNYIAGRTSKHTIADMVARGWELLQRETTTQQEMSQMGSKLEDAGLPDDDEKGELTGEDLSTEEMI